MNREPWFRKNAAGGWWLPATRQGWGILGMFILTVLGCAWVPSDYRPPVLIAIGVSYMAASLWFSQPR